MRLGTSACVAVLALAWASTASAQDLNFRASAPARRAPQPLAADPIPVTISRPQAIASTDSPRIVRAQMGGDFIPPINVPPPPAYTGGVGPAPFPGGPPPTTAAARSGVNGSEEDYNCGRINNDADTGGVFTRTGNFFERCWYDISTGTGMTGTSDRKMFQSDTCFNGFISPVTNPHLFEDPRALTELRPIFMWQRTPNSNWVFQGNSNYFATLQARVALTQNISIVMNRLGWAWQDPANPTQGIQSGNGLSEINIGPKFTFIRNTETGTLAAMGLNFILPVGSSTVSQNTGDLSLAPYVSFGRNFLRSDYGSFNFLNTTGYSFSTDDVRTDFLYSSFHLDYDVGDLHKFYPLVELNWFYYAFNGGARDINFENNSLTNFGARQVSGLSDLNLALGARYKFSENIQFGIAGEMNVLGGGRHMDLFRLTADMIFRY